MVPHYQQQYPLQVQYDDNLTGLVVGVPCAALPTKKTSLPILPLHHIVHLQDQDCFGGCFSPSDAFFGEMAVVRVWRRVVPAEQVRLGCDQGGSGV